MRVSGILAHQIPVDESGGFVVRVDIPHDPPVAEEVRKFCTGTVKFGGHQNVNERAAQIQLSKLLEAGFLPNNLYLVEDAKNPGKYTLHVWLDTDKSSTRKTFEEMGVAGSFAFDVISAKWSFVMVYDNGDSWSFNMSGRTLDDRQSTYFVLVPKVTTAIIEDSVGTPRIVPCNKSPSHPERLMKVEKFIVSKTAMELALERILGKQSD